MSGPPNSQWVWIVNRIIRSDNKVRILLTIRNTPLVIACLTRSVSLCKHSKNVLKHLEERMFRQWSGCRLRMMAGELVRLVYYWREMPVHTRLVVRRYENIWTEIKSFLHEQCGLHVFKEGTAGLNRIFNDQPIIPCNYWNNICLILECVSIV